MSKPTKFKWGEWLTYEEDEGAGQWINCIHEAIMTGRLKFAISVGVLCTLTGTEFSHGNYMPRVLTSLEFATFNELYPVIRQGLGTPASYNSVSFTSTLKGKEGQFFMDLVDKRMTLCYMDER